MSVTAVGARGDVLRRLLLAGAAWLLLAGCAIVSQRGAAEEAWQARDRERAVQCQREGGRYFSGTCARGGGP